MKTNVFLTACILFATVALGQNKEENELVVKAPQFKTEMYNTIDDFLARNIEYPDELKNRGIEGTEVIQFTVTQDGKLTDFKVINSISPNLDDQIIQSLKITSGKWNPAMVAGKPVPMEKEVSITFFLHSEKDLIKLAKDYQKKGNEWMFVKENPEKALKFYNQGAILLPNEESLLAMRSYCQYMLGDNDGALKDWERLKILASRKGDAAEKYFATQNLNWYHAKIASVLVNPGIE